MRGSEVGGLETSSSPSLVLPIDWWGSLRKASRENSVLEVPGGFVCARVQDLPVDGGHTGDGVVVTDALG